MILLISLVFVALAAGAFSTDLPFAEKLFGGYVFLSIAALSVVANVAGMRLMLGRKPRLAVRHVEADGGGAEIRLGRRVPGWYLVTLLVWGLGWFGVAALVAVLGFEGDVVAKVLVVGACVLFGVIVLLAWRRESVRAGAFESAKVVVTPSFVRFAVREAEVSWDDVARIVSARDGRRSAIVYLHVHLGPSADVIRVRAPGGTECDLVVRELRRLLDDPTARSELSRPAYADRLSARLTGRT